MDAARSNLTPDDDDDAYIDAEVIDAPSRVVSVALVPMETGLRAYDPPNGKPLDMRWLEAKVAALRFLKEFPEAEPHEILTLLAAFDLDRDVKLPDTTACGDCGDCDACAANDKAWRDSPSQHVLEETERYAETHYGRVHVGDDWPEVKAEKERKQAAREAATARTLAMYAENAAERAAVPRDDAVDAPQTRDAEARPEVLESVPTASTTRTVDTGYSVKYRKLVETVLSNIEASDTLDSLAVLVARVMLDRADANTRQTWQSPATIGRRAHVNEDTARDRLEALRLAGVIEVARQGGRGPGNATRWRFI